MIAPQIGPKEAPTIEKKLIRFSAAPVIARTIATVTANIVEEKRGTAGIIVAKLLPAMKAQKQAEGMEASANNRNIDEARKPPIPAMTESYAKLCKPGLRPCAPATDSKGRPPA